MNIRYTILDIQREELIGLFKTLEGAKEYAGKNLAIWRVYEIDIEDVIQ